MALCRTQRSAVSCLFSQRASVANEPSLVILFHGIGASGAQMRPLASSWQLSLPDTRFVSPDAPFQRSSGPGHLWFHIDGDQLRPDRLNETRSAFDRTVGEIVDREGFANALPRVAFVGVSQGAIVSLDAIASGRWNVGAVVAYSGMLPPLPVSPASKSTRILFVHGQNDRTIPSFASSLASSQFEAAGFNTELKVEPGVGHTISMTGAQHGLVFLKSHLA